MEGIRSQIEANARLCLTFAAATVEKTSFSGPSSSSRRPTSVLKHTGSLLTCVAEEGPNKHNGYRAFVLRGPECKLVLMGTEQASPLEALDDLLAVSCRALTRFMLRAQGLDIYVTDSTSEKNLRNVGKDPFIDYKLAEPQMIPGPEGEDVIDAWYLGVERENAGDQVTPKDFSRGLHRRESNPTTPRRRVSNAARLPVEDILYSARDENAAIVKRTRESKKQELQSPVERSDEG